MRFEVTLNKLRSWQRMRVGFKNKVIFDPQKDEKQSDAAEVAIEWRRFLVENNLPETEHPLTICRSVNVYIFAVKGVQKKSLHHTPLSAKPDLDRIVNYYLDVLTMAGVIDDDKFVTSISSYKRYGPKDEVTIAVSF